MTAYPRMKRYRKGAQSKQGIKQRHGKMIMMFVDSVAIRHLNDAERNLCKTR